MGVHCPRCVAEAKWHTLSGAASPWAYSGSRAALPLVPAIVDLLTQRPREAMMLTVCGIADGGAAKGVRANITQWRQVRL